MVDGHHVLLSALQIEPDPRAAAPEGIGHPVANGQNTTPRSALQQRSDRRIRSLYVPLGLDDDESLAWTKPDATRSFCTALGVRVV